MKKPTADEKRAAADRLGQIEAEMAPLEALKSERDELRAQMRGWYAHLAPEAKFLIAGYKFSATVGQMENERKIRDMKGVFNALGSGKFLENCGFTLKRLAELLTPDAVKALVEEARTGARPVKTFPNTK